MIIYAGEKDKQKCICRGIRSSLESNEGGWNVRESVISDPAINLDNWNDHLQPPTINLPDRNLLHQL